MMYTTYFYNNKKLQKFQKFQKSQKPDNFLKGQMAIICLKENSSLLFSYTLFENILSNQEIRNKSTIGKGNASSIYSRYFFWSTFIAIKPNHNDTFHLDSIMIYFTSLFAFKIKLNLYKESQCFSFFNKYNYLYQRQYNKNHTSFSSSKENTFFYTKKTDEFFNSEFFNNTQETTFTLFNTIYNTFSRGKQMGEKRDKKKISKKKRKSNKNRQILVSKRFFNILNKKESNQITYKIKKKLQVFLSNKKFKFKRLFKLCKKIKKIRRSKFGEFPFKREFIKKIKKKTTFGRRKPVRFFQKNPLKITVKQVQNSRKIQSITFKLVPTQFSEKYINSDSSEQIKKRISILTNSTFSFYKLNALSLTRFQFEMTRVKENIKNPRRAKNKKSIEFLDELEKKRSSRYRNVAIYIKDIVRITFFARFLKKARFLANFYAFLLSKLPRKRKETKLIKFLLTTLKVFSTQRPERVAIRLRFQGRLNRWRRTKSITGQKGYLEYYAYKSRIEFGIGQAITRKGTQGIRIWLCYDTSFKNLLKQSIFTYVSLTSLLKKEKTDNVST